MLITLLAWFYISFLCWIWGITVLNLFKRVTGNEIVIPHFGLICLTGLSGITIVAGFLSLFFPLGSLWTDLILLTPLLHILLSKKRNEYFISQKKITEGYHLLSVILFFTLSFLLLVMATWTVVHPDTLGYHAQTIQWIENYKAVPGLVHLHFRFGLQSFWFVNNAAIGNILSGFERITLLNSTVLFWFFLFITERINYNFFGTGKRSAGVCWLILLSLSMWSYTQVRLTATSASPDFIAVLYVLAIIYLLLEKNTKKLNSAEWLLAAFLSLVAVTIKLSVAPLLIITAAASILFLLKKRIKMFVATVTIFILTLLPFVARNIITSGYVLFPSVAIDIANVDWKYSREQTIAEKHYISAYAKKEGVTSKEEIDSVNQMTCMEWLPGWWQQQSFADKTIIILLALSIITLLFFLKKIIQSGFITALILATMLSGIVFWFINAPDPRFGFGFILGFIATIAHIIFKEREISLPKNISYFLLAIFSAATLTYTGYRLSNFFEKEQWLKPIGIEKTEYTSFICEGAEFNTVSKEKDFGNTPVPCTDLNCDKFSLRGKEISTGFKSKKHP
jgi:hypothetical protein